RLDARALELVLLGRVDRLQRARLPELDVLAEIELHGLEDVETAGSEVRLQIRLVAPADRVDLARVDAGGAGGDLAALEQCHATAERGEVVGCRRAGDPASHHEDVRLVNHDGLTAGQPTPRAEASRSKPDQQKAAPLVQMPVSKGRKPWHAPRTLLRPMPIVSLTGAMAVVVVCILAPSGYTLLSLAGMAPMTVPIFLGWLGWLQLVH